MAEVSLLRAIKLGIRGMHNYITKRPLVVGYEVTLSCNLNCRHCDLGGLVKDEKQIKPEEYGDLARRLSAVAAVFSGERQSELRGQPALYRHLEQTLPRLAKLGFRDVLLNTAISKANVREILPLANRAIEWGVGISYSAYTPLRTNDQGYCVESEEDLRVLRQAINELVALRKRDNHIANAEAILLNTLKFFEQACM